MERTGITQGLSDKQRKVYDFIRDYYRKRGYPPTIREIQQALNISSTSVVDYHLKSLEKKRLIKRLKRISRGIVLLESYEAPDSSSPETIKIGLLGYIYADRPLPGPDTLPDEFIYLTRDIVPPGKELFALRVRGDSMIDALVYNNDIVILERVEEIRDGDMVAVWLKDRGQTTLKYLYRDGERIRLQPAHPYMEPIYIDDPQNVEVQGRVVMVIRHLSR